MDKFDTFVIIRIYLRRSDLNVLINEIYLFDSVLSLGLYSR